MSNIFINPSKEQWPLIIQRPAIDSAPLEAMVAAILNDVKVNGDEAVKKYALQFDKVALADLRVTEDEMEEAVRSIDDDLKSAIQTAKNNITAFHESQREELKKIETTKGVECWRKSIAIQKVGLYIPGGTAPLFSTLLMLGIPAVLAGCSEIIVCTPSDKNGTVNAAVLYVANLIGIKSIFKIGGVQAIAAMAYGTESVPQIYKLFGPGNQYVTCAKKLINKEGVAIDMPAGPSEVAVYADETCNAEFVAADLLSQAEHGADSQVVLVASTKSILDDVNKAIEKQLASLPRKQIAEKALDCSHFVVMENMESAFELLNEYAAEHLIIATDNANELANKIINAGSVFLGHYSPESVGDYASGTNHTLPTNGYAKAYSGVSLDSFVKKVTFQQLTKAGLMNIGSAVQQMADAEGLDAHRNAVSVRIKQ
jgi:histidinol dehydrogenase